jgi:nitric oxide reductase NorD protein
LIEDARKSVEELDQQGIFSYCINLDRKADDYVDIFGRRYTVIASSVCRSVWLLTR